MHRFVFQYIYSYTFGAVHVLSNVLLRVGISTRKFSSPRFERLNFYTTIWCFLFCFFFMPTTLKWNSYVVNEFRMVEMYEFGGIFTRYLLIEWCHRYTRAKEVTPIIFHTIAKPCELACMCIGFASIGLSTLSYFVNDGVKSKFHSVSLSDFSFAQWSITISRIQVDRALINVRMKKHDA